MKLFRDFSQPFRRTKVAIVSVGVVVVLSLCVSVAVTEKSGNGTSKRSGSKDLGHIRSSTISTNFASLKNATFKVPTNKNKHKKHGKGSKSNSTVASSSSSKPSSTTATRISSTTTEIPRLEVPAKDVSRKSAAAYSARSLDSTGNLTLTEVIPDQIMASSDIDHDFINHVAAAPPPPGFMENSGYQQEDGGDMSTDAEQQMPGPSEVNFPQSFEKFGVQDSLLFKGGSDTHNKRRKESQGNGGFSTGFKAGGRSNSDGHNKRRQDFDGFEQFGPQIHGGNSGSPTTFQQSGSFNPKSGGTSYGFQSGTPPQPTSGGAYEFPGGGLQEINPFQISHASQNSPRTNHGPGHISTLSGPAQTFRSSGGRSYFPSPSASNYESWQPSQSEYPTTGAERRSGNDRDISKLIKHKARQQSQNSAPVNQGFSVPSSDQTQHDSPPQNSQSNEGFLGSFKTGDIPQVLDSPKEVTSHGFDTESAPQNSQSVEGSPLPQAATLQQDPPEGFESEETVGNQQSNTPVNNGDDDGGQSEGSPGNGPAGFTDFGSFGDPDGNTQASPSDRLPGEPEGFNVFSGRPPPLGGISETPGNDAPTDAGKTPENLDGQNEGFHIKTKVNPHMKEQHQQPKKKTKQRAHSGHQDQPATVSNVEQSQGFGDFDGFRGSSLPVSQNDHPTPELANFQGPAQNFQNARNKQQNIPQAHNQFHRSVDGPGSGFHNGHLDSSPFQDAPFNGQNLQHQSTRGSGSQRFGFPGSNQGPQYHNTQSAVVNQGFGGFPGNSLEQNPAQPNEFVGFAQNNLNSQGFPGGQSQGFATGFPGGNLQSHNTQAQGLGTFPGGNIQSQGFGAGFPGGSSQLNNAQSQGLDSFRASHPDISNGPSQGFGGFPRGNLGQQNTPPQGFNGFPAGNSVHQHSPSQGFGGFPGGNLGHQSTPPQGLNTFSGGNVGLKNVPQGFGRFPGTNSVQQNTPPQGFGGFPGGPLGQQNTPSQAFSGFRASHPDQNGSPHDVGGFLGSGQLQNAHPSNQGSFTGGNHGLHQSHSQGFQGFPGNSIGQQHHAHSQGFEIPSHIQNTPQIPPPTTDGFGYSGNFYPNAQQHHPGQKAPRLNGFHTLAAPSLLPVHTVSGESQSLENDPRVPAQTPSVPAQPNVGMSSEGGDSAPLQSPHNIQLQPHELSGYSGEGNDVTQPLLPQMNNAQHHPIQPGQTLGKGFQNFGHFPGQHSSLPLKSTAADVPQHQQGFSQQQQGFQNFGNFQNGLNQQPHQPNFPSTSQDTSVSNEGTAGFQQDADGSFSNENSVEQGAPVATPGFAPQGFNGFRHENSPFQGQHHPQNHNLGQQPHQQAPATGLGPQNVNPGLGAIGPVPFNLGNQGLGNLPAPRPNFLGGGMAAVNGNPGGFGLGPVGPGDSSINDGSNSAGIDDGSGLHGGGPPIGHHPPHGNNFFFSKPAITGAVLGGGPSIGLGLLKGGDEKNKDHLTIKQKLKYPIAKVIKILLEYGQKVLEFYAKFAIPKDHYLRVLSFVGVYLLFAYIYKDNEHLFQPKCESWGWNGPEQFSFHAPARFVPALPVDPHMQQEFLDLFRGVENCLDQKKAKDKKKKKKKKKDKHKDKSSSEEDDDMRRRSDDSEEDDRSMEEHYGTELKFINNMCPRSQFFFSMSPYHIEAWSALAQLFVAQKTPADVLHVARSLLLSHSVNPKVWYLGLMAAAAQRPDMTGFSLAHPLDAFPDVFIPGHLIADEMDKYRGLLRRKRSIIFLEGNTTQSQPLILLQRKGDVGTTNIGGNTTVILLEKGYATNANGTFETEDKNGKSMLSKRQGTQQSSEEHEHDDDEIDESGDDDDDNRVEQNKKNPLGYGFGYIGDGFGKQKYYNNNQVGNGGGGGNGNGGTGGGDGDDGDGDRDKKKGKGKGHKKGKGKGKGKGKKKKDKKKCTIIDGSVGLDNGIENKLWYWREDLMVNQHHWYWHQIYPLNASMHGDRRAELFFYMHRSMIARYNAERLSNGFHRTAEFNLKPGAVIDEHYNSHLKDFNSGSWWTPRAPHTKLADIFHVHDPDFARDILVNDVITLYNRLLLAIKLGKLITATGKPLPIRFHAGLEPLANTIEASNISVNPLYYDAFGFHNLGHFLIALSSDPDFSKQLPTGVMSEGGVAMRDPVFYTFHTLLDNMFDKFKQTLQPYRPYGSVWPLQWHGVDIVDVKVTTSGSHVHNQLTTFYIKHKFLLEPGVDRSIAKGIDKAEICAVHLDHSPFQFEITIDRKKCAKSKSGQGTVRIFMAPRYSETGDRLPYVEQRLLMFQLDAFQVDLKVGRNVITRSSRDNALTKPWSRSLTDFERGPDPSGAADYCGCGWPHHLFIPKGNTKGMAFDLFVMVTNFDEDYVTDRPADLAYPEPCNSPYIFCGRPRRRYPDARPMGYPFDRLPYSIPVKHCGNGLTFKDLLCKITGKFFTRPVATLEEYVAGATNMAMTVVDITHIPKVIGKHYG